MDKSDQQEFDKTSSLVNSTLTIIVGLFNLLGVDGMKALIDPTLDEITSQIKLMRRAIDDYESDLLKLESSNNSVMALVFMQNIKQGLLFTESLMLAVQNENLEACLKHVADIKKMNITSPSWD